MNIKVLGSGCKYCEMLYENAKKAAASIGKDITVDYITDMKKVMSYGVMKMPCVVIDEKVVSQGKVLNEEEIKKLCMN